MAAVVASAPPGQRVGYARVSTLEQNEERQLHEIELDRLFTDKASGKDTRRPQLEELLAYVRPGDTVVVHSMDRLARNLSDLLQIVQGLTERGVRVEFVKEALIFTGDDNPMARLMLAIMGGVAEFERAMIRERQREGIALAKNRGVYKGRPRKLTEADVTEIKRLRALGHSAKSLMEKYDVSRRTFYSYVKGE